MDAAGNFACGIESWNNCSRPVKYLRLDVGIETAHCVVNGHAGITSPEGTLIDALRQVNCSLAKVLVFLVLHIDVVIALDRLLQTIRIDAHLLRKFADRRSRPSLACFDALHNCRTVYFIVGGEVFVVADRIGVAFRCAEHSVTNHIASGAFINNTGTALVNIDGTVDVKVEQQLHLLACRSTRRRLDEIHAYEITAHPDGCHCNFARRSGQIVGTKTCNARIMEFAQVFVGAETAGSENNTAGSTNTLDFSLRVLCDHTKHITFKRFLANNFLNTHAGAHFYAELLCGLGKHRPVALSLRQRRNVRTRIERTENLNHLGLELHAETLEPLDRRIRIAAKHVHAIFLPAEVTGFKRLLCMVLPRILDTLLRLANRVSRVDETLRDECIAAREIQLLKHHNVLGAFLCSLDSGGHAGSAGSDNDDFISFVPLIGLSCTNCAREHGSGSYSGSRSKLQETAAGDGLFVHCGPLKKT